MSGAGWGELAALVVLLAISTPVLGSYMYKVFDGQPVVGDRVFLPVERLVYRAAGIDPDGEQRWSTYARALLAFSFTGFLLLYGVLRFQRHLPFNPDHQVAVGPGVAFNTAISFLTNTNWQVYAGESTMSHLSQMFGLVLQQFLSAAVGIAVVVALIRGLVRRRSRTLGNFWVDTTRAVTRLLLPLALVSAIVLISQGVIQDFQPTTTVHTLAGATQHVPGGPVASQTAIELLGDNGGGFFNANTGHPYEDPNSICVLLEAWISLMIAFALPWTFGRWVRSRGQGLVVLASMAVLFLAPLVATYALEGNGNPKQVGGVSQAATTLQAGGNLEGKELRIGVPGSALSTAAVTATSNGGNNAAHESFTPLAGAMPLVNMMLGEVSPGGTGSGLYGKLVLAILSVFIAGLMVGRTPEYLGKKIQAAEMKLVVLFVVFVPAVILIGAGVSAVFDPATAKLSSSGAHGLTELVYAYTSAANNNGSAFAGITSSTQWYETTLAACMFVGRFFLIIPVLAIAGSLGRKQVVPATAGTFRTDTPVFVVLLLGVTVILVGLTYFPVVALGPIVEHLAGHF